MLSLPIIETVVSVVTAVLTAGGLAALFGLMAIESLGLPPLPSEVILPFAGYLVFTGVYPFWAAFLAALAGAVVGAYAAYAIGRDGRHWLERPGTGGLRVDPKHLKAMDDWFAHHGESTVGPARLLPIVRAYISFPAGTARMDLKKFGIYTALGGAPFTAALLYVGVLLGKNWNEVQSTFRYLDVVAGVVIVVGIVYVAYRWRRGRSAKRPGPSQP